MSYETGYTRPPPLGWQGWTVLLATVATIIGCAVAAFVFDDGRWLIPILGIGILIAAG